MDPITQIAFTVTHRISPGPSEIWWIEIMKNETTQVMHPTTPGNTIPLSAEQPAVFQTKKLLAIPSARAIAFPDSLQNQICNNLSEILPDFNLASCHSQAAEITSNFLSLVSSLMDSAAEIFISVEVDVVRNISAPPVTLAGNVLDDAREGEPVDGTLILQSVEEEELQRKTGASEAAIERLRRQTIVVPNNVILGDLCSICLEELSCKQKVMKMPCTHLYHEACIVPWLQGSNSCPTCRSKIEL